MKIEFRYTSEFLRESKILSKHYRSFKDDLKSFLEEYAQNPDIGDDLGDGIRKVRMKIASKGKGKSGGARVITFTLYFDTSSSIVVLVYVYNKSERSSISKNDIIGILKKNDITLPQP